MSRDHNKRPAIAASIILIISLIVLIAIAQPAAGHETDQYTLPPQRQFADMGPYLTKFIYNTIARGVNRQNARIRSAIASKSRSAVAKLQSPDEIAAAVNEEFPVALFFIESLDSTATSNGIKAKYPGRVVGYKPTVGVRKNVDLAINPLRAWNCATINAYGVYMGTDKMGHFADMGMHYYTTYRDAKRGGASDEKAMREVLKLGTSDPIYSETGLLGLVTAGAYSNADLVANFMGFMFYRNLTETVTLKGQERPPMIVRDGQFLKVADHVRPESDFFSWYLSDHLNEALNPSVYRIDLRGGIRKAIVQFRKGIVPRYADANGNLHSPDYFAAKTAELSTYWGVSYGHDGDKELIRISEFCFAKPPDMNKPAVANDDGLFPLHYVAMRGDVDAAKKLLESGADVNARVLVPDSVAALRGDTPLHLAAREGNLDTVVLLLSHGADVNARNDRGITPLHMCVEFADVAATLYGAGADLDAVDEKGRTPLHWAANDAKSSAFDVLILNKARLSVRDRDRQTPLHLAAKSGHDRAVNSLLAAGVVVDVFDRFNQTPLHLAVANGQRVTDQLLRGGASPSYHDDFGCTPLHVAIRAGKEDVVASLLAGGADPRTPDAYGETPLATAQRSNRVSIVALLERPNETPAPPPPDETAVGQ